MHFTEKENRRTASTTVAHGFVIYQGGRSTGQESSAKADKPLLGSLGPAATKGCGHQKLKPDETLDGTGTHAV